MGSATSNLYLKGVRNRYELTLGTYTKIAKKEKNANSQFLTKVNSYEPTPPSTSERGKAMTRDFGVSREEHSGDGKPNPYNVCLSQIASYFIENVGLCHSLNATGNEPLFFWCPPAGSFSVKITSPKHKTRATRIDEGYRSSAQTLVGQHSFLSHKTLQERCKFPKGIRRARGIIIAFVWLHRSRRHACAKFFPLRQKPTITSCHRVNSGRRGYGPGAKKAKDKHREHHYGGRMSRCPFSPERKWGGGGGEASRWLAGLSLCSPNESFQRWRFERTGSKESVGDCGFATDEATSGYDIFVLF